MLAFCYACTCLTLLKLMKFHFLQRAAFLENDTEMEVAHSAAASAGETEVDVPLVIDVNSVVRYPLILSYL